MAQPTDEPMTATTVLVVEDEPLVRLMVCDMLNGMHLGVLEAADGQSGLALLRDAPSIGLVITDVSMPRMDGITMIAKARESRADLMVLLMSGLSIPPPGERFIRKPFRMAELQKQVAEMLGL